MPSKTPAAAKSIGVASLKATPTKVAHMKSMLKTATASRAGVPKCIAPSSTIV
jgi:hypothetical protein